MKPWEILNVIHSKTIVITQIKSNANEQELTQKKNGRLIPLIIGFAEIALLVFNASLIEVEVNCEVSWWGIANLDIDIKGVNFILR